MPRAFLIVSLFAALAVVGCDKKDASTVAPSAAPTSPTPPVTPTSQPAGAGGAGARTDRSTKAEVVDPSAISIAVTVDGAAKVWAVKDITSVPSIEVEGDSGDGARSAWDLRTLAGKLVGPTARVTTMTDEKGKVLEIKPESWSDTAKNPLLRINRRGIVKFVWASPDGEPIGGGLRGVVKIDLVTK